MKTTAALAALLSWSVTAPAPAAGVNVVHLAQSSCARAAHGPVRVDLRPGASLRCTHFLPTTSLRHGARAART